MVTNCEIEGLWFVRIHLGTRSCDRSHNCIKIHQLRLSSGIGCSHSTAALMTHNHNHGRTEVLNGIFETSDSSKGSSSSPAERTTNSSSNPASKTNSGGTRLSEQLSTATCGC